MALLLNVESSRELREGDEVRVLSGPRAGVVGKVVGFSLRSDSPVVVQYPAPRAGVVREEFGANDVKLTRAMTAPESLEPLPEIERMLVDGQLRRPQPCGTMLSLLAEGKSVTFVPTDSRTILGDLFEAEIQAGNSVEDALALVMERAFVTRLPHLTHSAMSHDIDALIEAQVEPETALQHLLSH